MAMNKKDKNLFKACVAMVLMIAMVGFLANSALKLAGDPLRVVGAVACAYYGLRLLVGFTVRRLPPKVRSRSSGLAGNPRTPCPPAVSQGVAGVALGRQACIHSFISDCPMAGVYTG